MRYSRPWRRTGTASGSRTPLRPRPGRARPPTSAPPCRPPWPPGHCGPATRWRSSVRLATRGSGDSCASTVQRPRPARQGLRSCPPPRPDSPARLLRHTVGRDQARRVRRRVGGQDRGDSGGRGGIHRRHERRGRGVDGGRLGVRRRQEDRELGGRLAEQGGQRRRRRHQMGRAEGLGHHQGGRHRRLGEALPARRTGVGLRVAAAGAHRASRGRAMGGAELGTEPADRRHRCGHQLEVGQAGPDRRRVLGI